MLRSFVSAEACARRNRKKSTPTATSRAKITPSVPRSKSKVCRTGSNRGGQIASATTTAQSANAMIRLSRLIWRRPYLRTTMTSRPTAARPARILIACMRLAGGWPVPWPPAIARQDLVGLDAVDVAFDHAEHRLDERLGQEMRLQPEVQELRVDRVVVVVFHLHARVL